MVGVHLIFHAFFQNSDRVVHYLFYLIFDLRTKKSRFAFPRCSTRFGVQGLAIASHLGFFFLFFFYFIYCNLLPWILVFIINIFFLFELLGTSELV